MMTKNKLLLLLALLMTAATGAWAQDAKHLITATYGKQTRLLEQPLPYATTIGELYEAVSGQSFSDLISIMSSVGMPLTGITSRNTSIVSIGDLNGASTPVTVKADGETTISLRFGSYAQAIYISVTSPLYVTMKEGTEDAAKWTATVGTNSTAQPLPEGGRSEGDQVTIQYSGRLKVKGVKAVSDAAAAAVPDGALNGKFSVSASKQVYFSKGNLRYASSKWSFFDNQYDYYNSYSADAWNHFGWSTSATTYGMNTSTSNGDYSGDFVDWGATMGAGWRTLTSDEWAYLLKTRSASTVNGTENGRYAKAKVNDVGGVILFPDTYTHPDGVAAPTGVNATDEYGWEGNSYTAADWTKMESAGCVFLPAAGCRYGSEMIGLGSYGYYGSATPDGADYAYSVKFISGSLEPANSINRCLGCSVRLVQEATSDAVPAEATPALSITSPSVGQVIGSDGKNYAYGIVPSGVTAVAKICYVSGSHGLALALADEQGTMNWSTAQTTCAAHTPAITGGTWKLASQAEWDNMINAAGSYTALRDGFNSVGGTNMQEEYYWSSTENGSDYARGHDFWDGSWDNVNKETVVYARACLAF